MKEVDTQGQSEAIGLGNGFLLFDSKHARFISYEIVGHYERRINLTIPTLPFNVSMEFLAASGFGSPLYFEPFKPYDGYVVTDEDLDIEKRMAKFEESSQTSRFRLLNSSTITLLYRVFPDEESRILAGDCLDKKPDYLELLNNIHLQVAFPTSDTVYETPLKPHFAKSLMKHPPRNYGSRFFFVNPECFFYPIDTGPLATDDNIPPGHGIGLGSWTNFEKNSQAISGKFVVKK